MYQEITAVWALTYSTVAVPSHVGGGEGEGEDRGRETF